VPLFVAQIAVTANGLIDTVMAGRLSAVDVAAVGLGASVYVSVHVGLMGILLALAPVLSRLHGSGQRDEIGAESRQGIWLALLVAIPGCIILAFPDLWITLAAPPADVAAIARPYLMAVSVGLPAALLFRVFHALAVSTSQPRLVMVLNLGALALKIPANWVFMHGIEAGGTTLIPALGGAGCAVATAVLAWLTVTATAIVLLRHRGLRTYQVLRPVAPDRRRLVRLLRLGLPIGATQLVEVTAFTFMAIFLARSGAMVAASHQIAATTAALCYMVALAVGLSTSTLAAQSIGAGQDAEARRIAIGGLRLALLGSSIVALLVVLLRSPMAAGFSKDPEVVAIAAPLLAMVAVFHWLDSLQTQLTMILRAWHVTALPALIHGLALWGLGLGGGWWLSFEIAAPGRPLHRLLGDATGFWLAGCVSLAIASIALAMLLRQVWRAELRADARAAMHR
jgi:MATE family multidrug resistance protein